MIQKKFSIEQKDWLDEATAVLWPAKLMEQLKKIVKLQIAEGYEDEQGFHFGARPTNGQ